MDVESVSSVDDDVVMQALTTDLAVGDPRTRRKSREPRKRTHREMAEPEDEEEESSSSRKRRVLEEPAAPIVETAPPIAETICVSTTTSNVTEAPSYDDSLQLIRAPSTPPSSERSSQRRFSSVRVFPANVRQRSSPPEKLPGDEPLLPPAEQQPRPEETLSLPTVGIASFAQSKHLQHVMRVLEATTPFDVVGRRVWLGLATFLDYYFAATFRLFLAENAVLRVIRLPSVSDFGAKFYPMGGNRYSVLLSADFDYWDRMLAVATALPDIYFRRNGLSRTYVKRVNNGGGDSVPLRLTDPLMSDYSSSSSSSSLPCRRSRGTEGENNDDDETRRFTVRDGNQLEQQQRARFSSKSSSATAAAAADAHHHHDDNDSSPMSSVYERTEELEAENAAVLDLAVAALCLAHRFEMLLDRDLRHKLPNYVTLAKMFSRNANSVNPFRISLASN